MSHSKIFLLKLNSKMILLIIEYIHLFIHSSIFTHLHSSRSIYTHSGKSLHILHSSTILSINLYSFHSSIRIDKKEGFAQIVPQCGGCRRQRWRRRRPALMATGGVESSGDLESGGDLESFGMKSVTI
jgi:hypothetical protein